MSVDIGLRIRRRKKNFYDLATMPNMASINARVRENFLCSRGDAMA
jgi:hypothetical protein